MGPLPGSDNYVELSRTENMKLGKEFRIGFFVTVILAVSFALINFLRGKDIFNREMTVISHYDDVAGLVPSAPVYVKGYKAGTVTGVEYDPQTGMFEVSCSVLRDFRIPADSRMTLYSTDIMGGKGIRIDLGTSDEAAANRAVLEPYFEQDFMSSVTSGIGPLAEKVSSAVDSLSAAVENVNRIMAAVDPASVSRTLAHIESVMSEVEALSEKIGGKSGELVSFIDNLENVSESLSAIMEKADTTVSNINGITSALDRSDIEGLAASFRSLLDKIQDPDGSIGRLLEGGEVYESVDALLSDIDSLVRKIEQNPKKYFRISVF